MTHAQATRKAKKLFGPRGHAQHRVWSQGGTYHERHSFAVGVVAFGAFLEVRGSSPQSWEAAFRDVEARKQRIADYRQRAAERVQKEMHR